MHSVEHDYSQDVEDKQEIDEQSRVFDTQSSGFAGEAFLDEK